MPRWVDKEENQETLWRQWKKLCSRLKRLAAMGLKKNTAKRWAGPWRWPGLGIHQALANGVIESLGYIPMKIA